MNTIKLQALSVFSLLLSTATMAQQPDTLQAIKTFVKVCNAYKQLPLQMDVSMTNSTNFVTDREDTFHTQAKFYLQQEGSYVSFGELEQVVSDSLMLLVSNNLKRMMVYATNRSVASQLQQYLGFQLKDSSLYAIAARYTAVLVAADKGTAGIEVSSRALVPHTGLPKETIRIQYKEASSQPSNIVQLKRSLLPVDSVTWQSYVQKPEWAGKLVTGLHNNLFLVKEQVSVFGYENISHIADAKLPVRISDRIRQEEPGRYAPAKAYEDYRLTQNF